ncbi:MAG: TetR/AcrR family transcriptional regulator [Spirochaetes bacterium]|jgi:AcrR family transcriptional regulator|nr:TetR/AcrR family transcriptional regulator [Spirochaetota bacterium]MBP8986881.1 TetR/AcrR family transcriptional regulator [Spirochaetota bacterium]HQL42906.1 TetR/AcrR family transcriptional regulator [Spirochaetota bacterium]
MPRIARNTEEVDSVKQQILDAAVKIISNNGFSKLSMRRIAAQLGVSATTIYNYYTSKDELYFYIRIKGFERLFEYFEKAYDIPVSTREKFIGIIHGYVDFGLTYPDYYEIMFLNRNVPKFLDCVGTPLEAVATKEKAVALKPFIFTVEKLQHHLDIEPKLAYELAMQLWVELNGLVSLCISRLLREVNEKQQRFVDSYLDTIVCRYLPVDME